MPQAASSPDGQRLVGAIGVVGHQHLVAGLEQRHRHQRNRRQATGHQQALQAALQRAQALFQQVGGGRAVQAVGVADLSFHSVLRMAATFGKITVEALNTPGCGAEKPCGRCDVGVVDQPGGGRRGAGFDEPGHTLHFSISLLGRIAS
jgi:hypothetical protein